MIASFFRRLGAILVALSISVSVYAATLLVDPTHRNASDGGAGTNIQPLQTIAEGMNRLRPGDTLSIAGGTYREPIRFSRQKWSKTSPTIVRAVEGAEVRIKGSRTLFKWERVRPGIWQHSLADEPQQVHVNGKPLKQVAGTVFDGFPEKPDHALKSLHAGQGGIWPGRVAGDANNIGPGAFFYDRASQKLLVGISQETLENTLIEVSLAPFLLQGEDLDGVTIQGLSFEHVSSTTKGRRGALILSGKNLLIDHIVVREVDGVGMTINGEDIVIQDSVFDNCGQLGINARGKRFQLLRNQTNGNNTRGFNKWWEAGGAKFIGQGGLKDSVVSGHVAMFNKGDGVWFDWGNERNRIERSVFAFNTGFGFQYEASSYAVITNNIAIGNGQRGIYFIDSRNSVIANNLIAFNKLEGIAIVEEGRKDSERILDLRPLDNAVIGNIFAWNTGPALILPGRQWNNRSDGNAYVISENQSSPVFSMGWPKSFRDRQSLDDWRSAQNQDGRSVAIKLEPSRDTLTAINGGKHPPQIAELQRAIEQIRVPPQTYHDIAGNLMSTGPSPGPRPR